MSHGRKSFDHYLGVYAIVNNNLEGFLVISVNISKKVIKKIQKFPVALYTVSSDRGRKIDHILQIIICLNTFEEDGKFELQKTIGFASPFILI